jgi:predicted phage terminase large subunit-like protein
VSFSYGPRRHYRGLLGADFVLLDQVRAGIDCPATVKAVRELSRKWPQNYAKLIEDKANGSAVIQMLQHEIVGIIPVNPEGGKLARAAAVSPLIEAGNVYLPHPPMRRGSAISLRSAPPSPTARTTIRSTP